MSNPASSTAYPVQALREHATALEAAITVALAKPTPKAVHKLRTESRRIEALLDLLTRVRGLPSFRRMAAKLLRQLKKLHRSAGRVRDLDVQQEMLEGHLLLHDSTKLHKDIQRNRSRQRKRASRELHDLLTEHKKKLARRVEALLKALEPAEALKLPPDDLLDLVRRDFESTHALLIRHPLSKHLHSIRKAAKLARYQAELAPGSAAARRAAKCYESLQEAGGTWHDWLDLAGFAVEKLGDDHSTAIHIVQLRDRHLDAFRDQLEAMRKDRRQDISAR